MINANQINVYRNAHMPGGLVGVPKNQFGGSDVQRVRLAALSGKDAKPLHGALPSGIGTGQGAGRANWAKGGLPDLSPNRAAPQAVRGNGVTQFSRQGGGNTAGLGAAPAKGGAPFDELRRGTVDAARDPLPKQAIPSMGRESTSAAAGKGGAQSAPFDTLRGRTVEASRDPLPKQALPSMGRQPTSAAATKGGAESTPFDQLRGRTVDAARQPLPKQPVPSMGRQPTTAGVAAPPPLRGLNKPSGGSVDAYRRLNASPSSGQRAAVAPSRARGGYERAPVAKAGVPPSVGTRRAAPSSGDYGRVAEPAPVPRVRAMAQADARAPMAGFSPQPKVSMPSISRSAPAPSMGAAVPAAAAWVASPWAAAGPAATWSAAVAGGGGGVGGGGGRANFSR